MNRNAIVAVVGVVLVLLISGGVLMSLSLYPATEYGDIHLYNERTDVEMSTVSTLNVQDGDFIVAWLRWNPDLGHKPTDEDFSTTLYRSDGLVIGTGRDRETTSSNPPLLQSSYRWWFDLDQCPQGTFTYFITYFARLEGSNDFVKSDSFRFQITNGEAPVYDDVVITVKPVDVGFEFGESLAYVQWTFSYDGSCVVDATLDGAEVKEQIYPASGVDQIFTYLVDTSVAGTFTVVFTVTPDDASNPAVSDTVMVTIAGSTTTTTTGTVPTTDTDTTTSGDDPEDEFPFFYIVIMVVVIVGLIIVAKVA